MPGENQMITELDVYQEEAAKTMKPMDLAEKNKYFMMKLQEELGEIAQLLSKYYFHDKPFDSEKLKEEIGDCMWYLSNLSLANGFKWSEVATNNINKLRTRHGEKYNKDFYTK